MNRIYNKKLLFLLVALIILPSVLYFAFGGSEPMNSITEVRNVNIRRFEQNDKLQARVVSYNAPDLPKKDSYTIILLGDSMVDAFGPNLDSLREHLEDFYPNTQFGLFNYGFAATTLETLMDRLTTETEYKGSKYTPILSRQFDIIIIESFGHNPIQQTDLETGFIKQEHLLQEAVKRISAEHPGSVIIFLATIGANKDNYAKGVKELRNEDSGQLAQVRNGYIKNHIEFARDHDIPLINVYDLALDRSGTTAPEFINKDSWIHPSGPGIELISRNIAEYIYFNKIIPVD